MEQRIRLGEGRQGTRRAVVSGQLGGAVEQAWKSEVKKAGGGFEGTAEWVEVERENGGGGCPFIVELQGGKDVGALKWAPAGLIY